MYDLCCFTFQKFSTWSSSSSYLHHHYNDILVTVLRFQTFFALQDSSKVVSVCAGHSAEMAVAIDPTEIRTWEMLAMKSLDDYVRLLRSDNG